jgi:hypothetical protein
MDLFATKTPVPKKQVELLKTDDEQDEGERFMFCFEATVGNVRFVSTWRCGTQAYIDRQLAALRKEFTQSGISVSIVK